MTAYISLAPPTRSVARSMPSLAPGLLLRGKHWDYRIIGDVKGDNSQPSNISKATVIPREKTLKAPKWAIIKNILPDDERGVRGITREQQAYSLPGIASATCFREMYDTIDSHTIALEWLESTMQDIKYQPTAHIYALLKTVLKQTLTACDFLARQKYVNTDFKPANILLSGLNTSHVISKVADLGLVLPAGDFFNVQPYAMRAPEVFIGQTCNEPSQVWAVAAMILCWIKPSILGVGDCPHFLVNDSWCMAKLKLLFPNWRIPTADEVNGPILQTNVKYALLFSEDKDKEIQELQAFSPFDEETRKIDMPEQLRDLLRLMLVVNPDERPSASTVLASKEFQAFQML